MEGTARLYQGFADPVRLRLLRLLDEGREVCVCHLHGALGVPQPTVSRHLATLRKLGLVVGRKDGLWVYYRRAEVSGLRRALLEGLGACPDGEEVFAEDRRRLEEALGGCCGP